MKKKMVKSVLYVVVSALALHANAQGGYREVVLQDGPVSYWRLNESAGAVTAVDERGVANGSYTNFPTPATANAGLGQAGPRPPTFEGFTDQNAAPHFDRTLNTRISVADCAALDITNSLTLEAWIKLDSLPPVNYHFGIVTKYRSQTGYVDQRSYALMLKGTAPKCLQMGLSSDGKYSADTAATHSSTTVFGSDQLGKWFHVVGVYDSHGGSDGGGSISLYINGVLDSTKSTGVPTSIYNSSTPLWIGDYWNIDGTWDFDGYIDEVAVYNKALSASQVQSHYNAKILRGTVILIF